MNCCEQECLSDKLDLICKPQTRREPRDRRGNRVFVYRE